MSGEIVQKTTYSDILDLLLEQYKDSTNLKALLEIEAVNDLAVEDALFEVRDCYWLSTAVGVQLDVIGSIVRVPRQGLSDTDYRAAITANTVINYSGSPEEVISYLKKWLNIVKNITLYWVLLRKIF